MPMKTLIEFPEDTLNRIISYVGQDDLISLMLTNYHFYRPCLKKLYSKIIIQTEAYLDGNTTNRCNDYLNTTRTTIYGFKDFRNTESQFKLIDARINTLIESLTINKELVEMVEEIHIMEPFNKKIRNSLRRLLVIFEGKHLNKLFIADSKLRLYLEPVVSKVKSDSIVIDKLIQFEELSYIPKELMISLEVENAFYHNQNVLEKLCHIIPQIDSLIVNSKITVYWKFIDILLKLKLNKLRLSTFRILYNHGVNILKLNQLISLLEVQKLKNLEVMLGCVDKDCNQDCLIGFLDSINGFSELKKLSIVQNITYFTHAANEIFDLNIINFIDGFKHLNYLSLKHLVPITGEFIDGFEGNYNRRFRIFSELFVRQNKIRCIVLPNLMMSFACYEQQMNHFLYNGCQCSHCQKYLKVLDNIMFTHKYYNYKLESFRDLVINHMSFVPSYYLSQRLVENDLLSNLFTLSFPMKNVSWDFHDNPFSIPFKCLNIEVIDEGDFDGDNELFFDTTENFHKCEYDSSIGFNNIGKVVCHYLNDLILRMCLLNRGDAEDIRIGVDMNDGTSQVFFDKLVVNGINYNVDKELNGTNYFTNVYDN